MAISFINNPNGLAATFDLGKDYINPFGKIVIPRDDAILKYVPLAHSLLSVRKNFQRVDLTHTENGTALTLNLSGFVKLANPDFIWDDQKRDTIQTLINQFFKAANEQGINPVDIDGLAANYSAMDQLEIDESDDDVRLLVEKINHVLSPMAQKHGGAFELGDLDLYDHSDLDEIPPHISKTKEPVGVIVSVFGACAGCGSFDLTYGRAAEEITKELDKINSPYQILHVKESQTLKGGMVFKRIL